MKKYVIKEATTGEIIEEFDFVVGNKIAEFDTIEEALKQIEIYEEEDKLNDCYDKDYYEIYDQEAKKIIYKHGLFL